MDASQHTRSANGDRLRHVSDTVREDYSANVDLKEYEDSADLYSQRALSRTRMRKGDWWIAISLYLLLFSMGVAIF